jgi:hypothetical protein
LELAAAGAADCAAAGDAINAHTPTAIRIREIRIRRLLFLDGSE